MNSNRFYVATDKLHHIASELLERNFQELDECVSPDELADRLFIDTEKKTFYFTDEQCVKEANEIIVEKYNLTHHSTNLKKVKQWKQIS